MIDKQVVLEKSLITNILYLLYLYSHDLFKQHQLLPNYLENRIVIFDLMNKYSLLTYDSMLSMYGINLYGGKIQNYDKFESLINILTKGYDEYDNFIKHLIKY